MADARPAADGADPAALEQTGATASGGGVAAAQQQPTVAAKRGAPDGGADAGAGDGDGAAPLAKQARLAAISGGATPGAASGSGAGSPPPSAAPPARMPYSTIRAAYSEDKGCRNTMEDVCVCVLDALPQAGAGGSGAPAPSLCRLSHFAVFDGHGGVSCAMFAAERLHARVLDAGLLSKGLSKDGKPDAKACKAAIAEGYKRVDEELLKECAAKGWVDGACAVAVWILQELVLVSNVGDAKCVLARKPDKAAPAGSSAQQQQQQTQAAAKLKAIVLTKEHTALLERQRIEKAGGTVVDGRLAGRIQIARSFGDAAFKKLGCSSAPDVTAFPLTAGRDVFLLLGCDGFWGVFGAQEAVDTATTLLAEGKDVKAVTARMLNMAIREKCCRDNCSLLLVALG